MKHTQFANHFLNRLHPQSSFYENQTGEKA
jgi:hypothetical protein